MNLKTIKTIGIFITFGICFLTHFVYSWFPNYLFSIFFPVNESVWEHMKMLVSAILIWQVVEYFLLKKFNVVYNNFLLSTFIMCVLAIPIFLIIYYPIFKIVGPNFVLNIICLFITIYFVYVVGYYVMKSNKVKNGFIIGLIGIVLLYTLFGLLTYFPLKNDMFLDLNENKYGVDKYII